MFDLPPVVVPDLSPLEKAAAIVREHGPIVSQSIVWKDLGISKQRVSHLVSTGRFQTFEIAGETWITVESVQAYKAHPRKGGRPRKAA